MGRLGSWWSLGVVVLVALSASGCYNGQLRIDGRRVGDLTVPGAQAELQQADIPVHRTLVLDDEGSFCFQDGFRSVLLAYHADEATVAEMAEFYLTQMPSAQWKLVRDVGGSPRRLLFEKGREECSLRIQGQGRGAKLTIEIHPQRT